MLEYGRECDSTGPLAAINLSPSVAMMNVNAIPQMLVPVFDADPLRCICATIPCPYATFGPEPAPEPVMKPRTPRQTQDSKLKPNTSSTDSVAPHHLLPPLLQSPIKHIRTTLAASRTRTRHASSTIIAHSPFLHFIPSAIHAVHEIPGSAPPNMIHRRDIPLPPQLPFQLLVGAEDGARRGGKDIACTAAATHGVFPQV